MAKELIRAAYGVARGRKVSAAERRAASMAPSRNGVRS